MSSLEKQIIAEADRCVRCGLCLPACPTYALSQQEGESPRGRIALLKGAASAQLSVSPTLVQHIDNCLACRACEVVCPAEVSYGKLLINGKTWLKKADARPQNIFLNMLMYGAKICRWFLLKKFRYSNNLNNLNKKIILLPGCVHMLLDKNIFTDSIKILNYLDYAIEIPGEYQCCGALAAHQGEPQTAEKFREENQALFARWAAKNIPILSTASGCSAYLQDTGLNSHGAQDMLDFLADNDILAKLRNLKFKPLNRSKKIPKILLHQPCTARNVLKQPIENIKNILALIPDCEIIYLKNSYCCGAAGSYFLEHADTAEKLAENILQEIRQHKPDFFITSNVGCSAHLKRALKKSVKDIDIEILHPVSLLARQLENRSP